MGGDGGGGVVVVIGGVGGVGLEDKCGNRDVGREESMSRNLYEEEDTTLAKGK